MSKLLNIVKVFLVLLTISFVVVRCRNQEYLNPDWIDPHDWSGEKDPLNQLCPKTQVCKQCERTAKPEYLRLVNSIFNPSQFRFDETTNYLYRTVHIHITKEQLEKLKQSTDPIFMDGLISEILAQTEFGTVQLVKEFTVDVATAVWKHLPSLPTIPSVTEINFNELPRSRPIFINFMILVLTYFLCRRYRINYLVAIIFGLVYCLYEYLDAECHKRIEVNEAVDFIYGKEKNPCLSPSKMSWVDWMVGRDSRSACRDFLARKTTHKKQCGVIDLFHEFFTSVMMKQLKLFFTTIAELVQSISTTNGLLITAVTLYFMKGLLVTIIQSMFKYVLNPTVWSRVATDINSTQSEQSTTTIKSILSPSDSDVLRDINMGKVLDLANQQFQLILEQKKIETSVIQSSGVEVLAVKDAESDKSVSENSLTVSANAAYKKEPSDGSYDSYEEFGSDEIFTSQKISIVSVPDSLPSTVSIGDTQPSEFSSEYSEKNYSTSSGKLSDKSEISESSAISDSVTSCDDSVEILSISSDATSS